MGISKIISQYNVKLDENSKDKWQIWYYDVKSKIKKKLETGTKFNRSISFSHDGKYIVFVCVDLFDDSTHFKNCDLFGTKEKNKQNIYNFIHWSLLAFPNYFAR